MSEINPIIKKLQFKDHGQPVLILNSPASYNEIISSFTGKVHKEMVDEQVDFVQIFGKSNEELTTLAEQAEKVVTEDGLFWLCYPKKSSKTYKGSNCSRETVTGLLSNQGYEPVRQVAIDEDWSALRFRKTDKIKKMTRKFAVTTEGKKRTEEYE